MRVVVALDSFKGSLGSRAAGGAVAAGVLSGEAHASVQVVPVAGGGEGTLEALGADAAWLEVETVDELGSALRALGFSHRAWTMRLCRAPGRAATAGLAEPDSGDLVTSRCV